MKNRCLAVILFLLSGFILTNPSCVDVSNAGGGTDIGNPSQACVVDEYNRPVPYARVKFISSRQWYTHAFNGEPVVFDSTFTDSQGYFSFDSLPSGEYNFQIDHDRGGAFLSNISPLDSLSEPITIKEYAMIRGTLTSISDVPFQLRLTGTDHRADVNPNSNTYQLEKVAEGVYDAMCLSTKLKWAYTDKIDAIPGETTISNAFPAFNSLLIDDFEAPGTTSRLGEYIEGDSIYAGSTEDGYSSATYSIVTDSYSGDYALHALLDRGNTQMTFSLIGFFLGEKPTGDTVWDFSSATGLSFYAKGSGTLTVSIESDVIDQLGQYNQFGADISLTPDWQQYTISFDTLTYPFNIGPNLTWQDVSDSIKRIEFSTFTATSEFWLDDITIHGVDIEALY